MVLLFGDIVLYVSFPNTQAIKPDSTGFLLRLYTPKAELT